MGFWGLYPWRLRGWSHREAEATSAAAIESWPARSPSAAGASPRRPGRCRRRPAHRHAPDERPGRRWPATGLFGCQAGRRWRNQQDRLDPQGLEVKIMQSYATSRGRLGVGQLPRRYVGLRPGWPSVRALQLVTADSAVLESARNPGRTCSRRPSWLRRRCTITESELDVVPQRAVHERRVTPVPLPDYARTSARLFWQTHGGAAQRRPVAAGLRRAGASRGPASAMTST